MEAESEKSSRSSAAVTGCRMLLTSFVCLFDFLMFSLPEDGMRFLRCAEEYWKFKLRLDFRKDLLCNNQ